tara:strand:+ start:61903 stop:62502 length:600 start_codon:yes stop_codon:yes gene_type:complete
VNYSDSLSRKAARENQVLDAASLCFVEKGFHGAGMAEIAQQANMSTGHIYHYFKNKQAIILAIVQREGDEAVQRIRELESIPAESFREAFFEHTVDAIKHKLSAFQTSLNFEIMAEGTRNPDVAQQMHEIDERIRKTLCEVLEPKLNIRNIQEVVDCIMTVLIGITARFARNPDRAEAVIDLLMLRTMGFLFDHGDDEV